MCKESEIKATVQNMRAASIPFYDLEVEYSGGGILLKIPLNLPINDPMLPQLIDAIEADKAIVKEISGLSPHSFSGIVRLLFTPEFTERENGD